MDSSSHTRIHIYSPTLISAGRLMRKPFEFNHSSTYIGFSFENAAETELVKNIHKTETELHLTIKDAFLSKSKPT